MKKEDGIKFNNLCDEFTEVFEKTSAVLDMMNQFQRNPESISETSKTGSAWIMDDVLESMETLKAKFYILNQELRAS